MRKKTDQHKLGLITSHAFTSIEALPGSNGGDPIRKTADASRSCVKVAMRKRAVISVCVCVLRRLTGDLSPLPQGVL